MNKKKKKNIVPKVETINLDIEPENLGGDSSEFSGGNSDNFKALDSLQAAGKSLPATLDADALQAAGKSLPATLDADALQAAGGSRPGAPDADALQAAGGSLPLKKRINLSKFPQWS